MATRKRSSELIFNLQWRNKPDNGGDKSNVIGMYDTPTTTSNFEMFKSYLLKNSGVAGNDVKVTYLTDDGQEWVIDSQEWFEIALTAFRLKARLGEVIYLKVDKISRRQMSRKHSNDVETQFDLDCSLESCAGAPPEWFVSYMNQFKRDVIEEVTLTVSTNLLANNTKEKETIPVVPSTSKKIKPETSKRSKKHLAFVETPIDRELYKTLKFDRKLEIKLDKLDAKTKKIKEKKQALINKIEKFENDDQRQFGKSTTAEKPSASEEGGGVMNASLVNSSNRGIEHMLGGEVYLHTWEVINNGMLPWSSNTELRLTWGSAHLKPSVNSVRCPHLQPGEKGTISVCFEVPKKPGTYESYWNFYNNNVRFGNSLSCCIVVEEPLAAIIPEELPFNIKEEKKSRMSPKLKTEQIGKVILFPEEKEPVTIHIPKETKRVVFCDSSKSIEIPLPQSAEPTAKEEDCKVDQLVKIYNTPEAPGENCFNMTDSGVLNDLSQKIENMNITDSAHPDSDSDWESVNEAKVSNKYGIMEKDLVVDLSVNSNEEEPKQDDNNNQKEEANSSESSDLSSGYDLLNPPEDDEIDDGYVYITIDGNKLPVPRHILRPDVLARAEEAPRPMEVPAEEPAAAAVVPDLSHCSATGSTFSDATSNRLFIFPQNQPGYEVVAKSLEETKQAERELLDHVYANPDPYGPLDQSRCPYPSTYSYAFNHSSCYPYTYEHVPNYQQSEAATAPPTPSQASPPSPPAAPAGAAPVHPSPAPPGATPVHLLPENLVSGAVNVASSAINTARSVINMIVPPKSEPGKWVNGRWVTEDQDSVRAKNLCILAEMGFWDSNLNATLLARYNDDLDRVVNELLQQ